MKRNKNGHFVFAFTGENLTGRQVIERFESAGFRIGDSSCLIGKEEDGYDKKHRLADRSEYQVVLMPSGEVRCDNWFDRRIGVIREHAAKFGYESPLAGIAPYVREAVSKTVMEKMGIEYITIFHEPIRDSAGVPRMLTVYWHGVDRWLCAGWANPVHRWWDDRGAFAFLVPADSDSRQGRNLLR